MTTEENKKIIEDSFDYLVGVIKGTHYVENYSEAMKLATKIVDEGYLLERHSHWVYDEYTDCIVCSMCYNKALANPEAPDKTMLTDYCPHCGANMNRKD